MPHAPCELLVAIVSLEQSDGLVFSHAHHYLPLLSVLARCAVGAEQVDVILRVGQSHASRLRLGPRHRAERHGGLGLSEALLHLYACELVEPVVHRRVERLARRAAVAKRRQVVLGEVLAYHETVYGGRRAERCDVILLYLAQQFVGGELLVVEHEHRRSGEPLSVELAPHSLSPSRVCHGEVYAVFREVVPERSGDEMSEGVEEVVSHHLRLSAGAAGEIHQHGVAVAVDVLWSDERRYVLPFGVPVVETGWHIGTHAYESLHGRALRHGFAHLREHIFLAHAYYRLHSGAGVAVYYVVLRQHVRSRYCHCSELVEREHGEPPLIPSFENEHHHVAVSYPQ